MKKSNEIEFKCHEHHLKMDIGEYIEKMKQYRDKNINSETCDKHNNKYFSYCFDCNKHLCEECVKIENHIYHYKLYLLEIKPDIKIVNKIEDKINKNKTKIKQLNDEKIKKENKLKDIWINNINKIKEMKDKNKEMNENKKYKEIELYKDNYKTKIKSLKGEFENKIKSIKLEYKQKINDIKNKYKNINRTNEYIYNNKMNIIEMKYNTIKNNYKYKDKIEKLSNLNKLNQIIYSTYINNSNNFYNSKNIMNLYCNFSQNNKKLYLNKLEEKDIMIKEQDIIVCCIYIINKYLKILKFTNMINYIKNFS